MEDRPKRCDADVHPMLVADASREDEADVHHRRTCEEQL